MCAISVPVFAWSLRKKLHFFFSLPGRRGTTGNHLTWAARPQRRERPCIETTETPENNQLQKTKQEVAVGVVARQPDVDTLLENPEKVIAFMDAMGADFRSLVEALLNYITELKSMVTFKVSLHSESESAEGKSVGAILEAQERATTS